MGPNGSGKSTLIKVLGLLLEPHSGCLSLFNEQVTPKTNRRSLVRRMTTVFQSPLLLRGSVKRNVLSGLYIRGVPKVEARRRAGQWMETFGISHLADQSAHTLSAGEAQRTSLARAFAIEPELLLLDEPFATLDMPTRDKLIRETAVILRETHTATVFVTHDRSEALTLSDEMMVLIDGRIVQHGIPEDVFSRPINDLVANFIGTENVISGVVLETEAGVSLVSVGRNKVQVVNDELVGTEVYLCMRPENVVLAKSAEAQTSVRNVLQGRVSAIEPRLSQMRIEIDCGFPLVAYITRESLMELELRCGMAIFASFKANAAHLMHR